jgi:hypothetical protein
LQADTKVKKHPTLVSCFQALGYHAHAEVTAHRREVLDNTATGGVGVDAPDKADVELQEVRLEVCEEVHARKSSAEVINRREKAVRLVGRENRDKMSVVDDLLVLGDFEDDAVERPARLRRCNKRCLETMFRVVDRVR